MYKFAFRNLWLKKSRSALALVGLSIAIIGIITLVSISAGIKYEVTNVISKMEGVTVMQADVFDDTQSYVSLSYKDDLESFSESKVVIPTVSGLAVNFEGKGRTLEAAPLGGMVALMGIDVREAVKSEKGGLYNPEILRGRFLKPNDKYSVMIGQAIADDYNKAVGSKVEFNNEKFTVVGIFTSDSNIFDRMVVIPIDIAQELTNRDSDTVGFFYIELKNPADAENLAKKINFRYEDDDLDATSGSGFAGEISGLLGNLDLFFYGVSSIALLVGAVGIINTMLMSVMERTKEFGILKAVGWTNDNILKLIIFESIFLGIIGGIIGIVIAVILVKFVAEPLLTFPMLITLDLVIEAFIIALILGVVGGVYPAWRASKLDPVQAIRFE